MVFCLTTFSLGFAFLVTEVPIIARSVGLGLISMTLRLFVSMLLISEKEPEQEREEAIFKKNLN